jgi:hypothetical protein
MLHDTWQDISTVPARIISLAILAMPIDSGIP